MASSHHPAVRPGMKQIELSAGTIEYQDIAKGPHLCYCTG
jgi:hypothetical protein